MKTSTGLAPNKDIIGSSAIWSIALIFLFACESSPDPQIPGQGYNSALGESGTGGTYSTVSNVDAGAAGSAGSTTVPPTNTIPMSGTGGGIDIAGAPAPAPICGDGIITLPQEQCEGTNLNGMTCAQLGAGPGELLCNAATCRYDTSKCPGQQPPPVGGSSGTAGTMNSGSGTGGTAGSTPPPTPVCTPNVTEAEPCGDCGERTRQCLADGSGWGEWSECVESGCAVDLPPECDGQTSAPSWNNGISSMLQGSCVCHSFQVGSYSAFVGWRGNSSMWDRDYTSGSGVHRLPANGLAMYNCWIALGLPEN